MLGRRVRLGENLKRQSSSMSWDPAILRKFQHHWSFRLLNHPAVSQGHPLQRQQGKETAAAVLVPDELALARLRCEPPIGYYSRSRRLQLATRSHQQSESSRAADWTQRFIQELRDRLNAIDMR